MDAEQAGTGKKRIWGLGVTLLFWFLLLSLIPMTVVSMISYRNARQSLMADAMHSMQGIIALKADYLHSFFADIERDMDAQSQYASNVRLLEELRGTFEKSGKTCEEFVKSFQARRIFHERGAGLKNFQQTYGYYDAFLVDEKGNILFSVMEEDDLGTNLMTGKYADSLLAKAFRKNTESGRMAFSDIERYAASNNEVAGFIVGSVVDDYGERIGALALQVPVDEIDRIMRLHVGLGQSEDIYLVGHDRRMRSNSSLSEEETILGEVVDTAQTRKWLEDHLASGNKEHEDHDAGADHDHDAGADHDQDAESVGKEYAQPIHVRHDENIIIYTGRRGVPVLGSHQSIDLAGTPMGMIAEVDEAEALAYAFKLRKTVILLLAATSLLVLVVAVIVARRITGPVLALSSGVSRVADGDLEQEVRVDAANEIGELADNFRIMLASLQRETESNARQQWLATGQAGLDKVMRGEYSTEELADRIISYVCKYSGAAIGALFVNTGDQTFTLAADFACNIAGEKKPSFRSGEGIVGQAVLDRAARTVTDAPAGYFTVCSGLIDGSPGYIHALPCIYGQEVVAALELGTFAPLTELEAAFLEKAVDAIAIAISMAASRGRLDEALRESRQLAEEMQSQQEELRVTNEELEEQARRLQASEEELKAQQEELQAANEELVEKARMLQEVI